MSQGTITEAKRDEAQDWSAEHGSYEAWTATIEAGDKRYTQKISRKRRPDGSTLGNPTGESVELKDGRWKVVKQDGFNTGTKVGGGKYEADPVKLKAENRRSALHAAISAADKLGQEAVSSDGMLAVAEKFHEFIEGKSGRPE